MCITNVTVHAPSCHESDSNCNLYNYEMYVHMLTIIYVSSMYDNNVSDTKLYVYLQ